MTDKKVNPPSSAVWLLRHTFPGYHNEALTGDLIEKFHEGQTRRWFWAQVFFASAVAALRAIRRRWSFFCYAVAGTIAQYIFEYTNALGQVSTLLRWNELPWPLSHFVFELSVPAIAALSSLSVLAGGLLIARSFRWAYLLRTCIVTLVLITMLHFSTDVFPWLLRPVPGNPYLKVFIIPRSIQVLLLASAYLVAAWLGCPLEEHARGSEGRSEGPQQARID